MSIKTSANSIINVQEEVIIEPQALELIVKADIPGEPQVSSDTILLQGKNIESNENLVMKFAGNYSSKIHDFQGANPFKARAIRDTSAIEGKQVVTESTLSVTDQVNSSHVDDINDALYAGYDQGGGKTLSNQYSS